MNTLNVHDTLLRWIDEAEYLAELNIGSGRRTGTLSGIRPPYVCQEVWDTSRQANG